MYDSQSIALRIKAIAKKQGVTISEMLSTINLSKNTMANFKTSMPKADNLAKIADYFNCSVDFLLGRTDKPEINQSDEQKHPITDNSYKEISNSPKKILPFYRTATSAGTGSYLHEDIPIEYVNVPVNEETKSADYILEVRGDSMEPKYFDGDCVLVKEQERLFEGEIGIFILNGESYIKKAGEGKLISLNHTYAPISLKEYDDIRCAGKVIGTIEIE